MRAFIVSIVLAVVMIVCTLLNHAYISRVLDSMDTLAASLPSDTVSGTASDVSAPATLWERNLPILSCTVNMKYLDRISSAAAEVTSRYAAGDDSEYLSAKDALLHALDVLREAERIGITGIL